MKEPRKYQFCNAIFDQQDIYGFRHKTTLTDSVGGWLAVLFSVMMLVAVGIF